MNKNLTKYLNRMICGATLLVGAGMAQAESVIYESTAFVTNDELEYVLEDFEVQQAGTYRATLVDYNFPESFDSLGLLINDSGTQELGRIENSGWFDFTAEVGIYTAAVWGDAGDTIGLSMYGVSIELMDNPISTPLPAALPLLGSAALVLAGLARHNAKRSAATA